VSGPLDPLSADLPEGVVGVFTTRAGGVSAPPWDELNLGLHVEDEPHAVMANRDRLARHLATSSVILPGQVHGAAVSVVGPAGAAETNALASDGLVTETPSTALGVLVADCLPVLIADPVARVVGVAHAGRRGLAAGVIQNTVAAMVALRARVGDCVAVIGPGVCGRCYEVPASMRDEVASLVPGTATTTRTGSPALDLVAGAERILSNAGIGVVRSTGICTVEDLRFYSYRRDGRTGRFAGVVMLTPDA
jgi:polyphenol oxidase